MVGRRLAGNTLVAGTAHVELPLYRKDLAITFSASALQLGNPVVDFYYYLGMTGMIKEWIGIDSIRQHVYPVLKNRVRTCSTIEAPRMQSTK